MLTTQKFCFNWLLQKQYSKEINRVNKLFLAIYLELFDVIDILLSSQGFNPFRMLAAILAFIIILKTIIVNGTFSLTLAQNLCRQ